MRYMGGKARIGKHIVNAMKGDIMQARRFIEPFVGGFNIVPHILGFDGSVECYDANAALIWLYRALIAGWAPPTEVTKEQYQSARFLPDDDPMKAFCAFGCSFAGKWFGGYAESRGRNYAKNCANSSGDPLYQVTAMAKSGFLPAANTQIRRYPYTRDRRYGLMWINDKDEFERMRAMRMLRPPSIGTGKDGKPTVYRHEIAMA